MKPIEETETRTICPVCYMPVPEKQLPTVATRAGAFFLRQEIRKQRTQTRAFRRKSHAWFARAT